MNNLPQSISIVIPIYNEESTLKETIESIKKTLGSFPVTWEIIAVNDGSTDNSLSILSGINDIIVVNQQKNKGYGASLKTGIKHSQYDLIMITDADGTYPTEAIGDIIKDCNFFDMTIGERDKHSPGIPIERRHAKRFLNKFASYLAGKHIPDLNSGMRIFKKEMVLKYWDLLPNRFSFTSTITMIGLTRGYEVRFIPIDYLKRSGKSSLKPHAFLNFLKLVTKLSLFFKPLKIFGPLSLTILLAALAIPTIFMLGITDRFFDTTFMVLVALSIQTFFFGLLAEIVIHNRK